MIVSIDKLNVNLSKYDTIDESLIASREYIRQYGLPEDYIEYHLYTKNGVLLSSNYDYRDYKIPGTLQGGTNTYTNEIEFYPENIINDSGITFGTYDIEFNIFRKKVFNTNQKVFFIKEISKDRTELRVTSNSISSNDIENGVLNFIYEIETAQYFKDFILNFGDNKLVNAVNIALDKNTTPYSFLIKLYAPLPAEFDLKASFWIVEELSDPHVYEVVVAPDPVILKDPFLKGPNFDLDVEDSSIKPSEYQNINTLLSNKSLNSYNKLLNLVNQKGIQVNVDYSDYSNFVHLSSASERLLNFKYKLSLIESYQDDIDNIKTTLNYSTATNSSASIQSLQDKINNVILNFDGYDNYLYYESESASWPKSNAEKPYTLFATDSTEVIEWLGSYDSYSGVYGGQLYTASYYDAENQDNLVNVVPEYISMDDANSGYLLFLNMVGQHFDNIWIYIKSITDLYKNNNNLSIGISKDLVYYALKSLGIKLYNSKSNENIFQYLLGSSPSGSYYPTGSTYDTVISASIETVSGQDIQKENLKKIYHNLPYLLKSKGTARGLKALISTFGVPDTILASNEFGGSDKNTTTLDYVYNRSSYALNVSASAVKNYWGAIYDYPTGSVKGYVPESVEFRFKIDKDHYERTSSLIDVVNSSNISNISAVLYPDIDNGYPYSKLDFKINGTEGYAHSTISAPFFMTESSGESVWWNVIMYRKDKYDITQNNTQQYYYLKVKNKLGDEIGHAEVATIYVAGAISSSYNVSWNQFSQSLYLGGYAKTFVGQFQELRYWTEKLTDSTFNYHVLNPESIRGNYSGSSYSELSARYPLGNNLLKYNHSSTPTVFSVQPNYKERAGIANAFIKSASFTGFKNEINYVENEENYVTDSNYAVYNNPVTEKIRIIDNQVSSSVLSPILRLENTSDVYLTKDIHFVDVSFSPQNEINKDIIGYYGSTLNIDDYIGDPRQDNQTSYSDLVKLNEEYYKKFLSRYNFKDYIRLINFYDNSLFKMIRDYVPARTNLLTGLTIKSPILERPKAKKVQSDVVENYNYRDGGIEAINISADSIYSSSYADGKDFYTGELSGSLIDINQVFENKNTNPYINFTESINDSFFVRSDYNVLMNNVSESVTSLIFKKINQYNGTLESVQISDSNYQDIKYTRPRYDGSKSTSATYNFYTEGDESYGKNASIDYKVAKFAFANNINKNNLNFYDKTTVNIKYLIDASGSVTELSNKNNNIFEVQNMFKKGNTLAVSLMDKFNPSNQSSLDGDKIIYEGGFKFSPIIYRETGEDLNFTYIVPTQTVGKRLGIKAVSTGSYLWQTQGDTNADFASTANNTNCIFKINNDASAGLNKAFSLSKKLSEAWPYNFISIKDYNKRLYKDYTNTFYPVSVSNEQLGYDIPSYYTLDWFLTANSGSSEGGYFTDNFIEKLKIQSAGSEYYSYGIAPINSKYIVNIDIPLKIKAFNPEPTNFGILTERREERGPSIIKVVAVLEVKRNGSGEWKSLDDGLNVMGPLNIGAPYGYTKMIATNIPIGDGGLERTNTTKALIDEEGSFIYFPTNTIGGTYNGKTISPYFEVRCQLFNKEIYLNSGDQIRVKFLFAEVTTFFVRNADIYFEILSGDNSKSYFEFYDAVNTAVTPVTTTVIDDVPPLFEKDNDNQSIIFNSDASLLYNNAIFEPPSNEKPTSISNFYSPVEYDFSFKKYDIIRFTSYYTINPEYFIVMNVEEPQFYYVNDANGVPTKTVLKQLKLTFDKQFNPQEISTSSFAILRKVEDETIIILDFKKKEGVASNAYIIPFNIKEEIKNSIGDIVAPLKDTVLSKVLLVG